MLQLVDEDRDGVELVALILIVHRRGQGWAKREVVGRSACCRDGWCASRVGVGWTRRVSCRGLNNKVGVRGRRCNRLPRRVVSMLQTRERLRCVYVCSARARASRGGDVWQLEGSVSRSNAGTAAVTEGACARLDRFHFSSASRATLPLTAIATE